MNKIGLFCSLLSKKRSGGLVWKCVAVFIYERRREREMGEKKKLGTNMWMVIWFRDFLF